MAADETTRERVLRVSARLFAAKGYHGTGMSELTKAIPLGRGGLYHHIGSKDALLAEIAYQPILSAADQAEAIVARDGLSPSEKVLLLAREMVRSIEADPDPWIVFFREYSSLPPDRQRAVLDQRARYLKAWESVVRDGAQRGEFCADEPLFLEGLLAFFIYSYIWVNQNTPESADSLGESLAQFILRGLSKQA